MRLNPLKRPSRRVTLVPRERVQQRTAEQIEDAPQSPEETIEAVTLVPRERVQQRTAEQCASNLLEERMPSVPREPQSEQICA